MSQCARLSLSGIMLDQQCSCRHFQTIFLGLPLENGVLLFALIKAKVKE